MAEPPSLSSQVDPGLLHFSRPYPQKKPSPSADKVSSGPFRKHLLFLSHFFSSNGAGVRAGTLRRSRPGGVSLPEVRSRLCRSICSKSPIQETLPYSQSARDRTNALATGLFTLKPLSKSIRVFPRDPIEAAVLGGLFLIFHHSGFGRFSCSCENTVSGVEVWMIATAAVRFSRLNIIVRSPAPDLSKASIRPLSLVFSEE